MLYISFYYNEMYFELFKYITFLHRQSILMVVTLKLLLKFDRMMTPISRPWRWRVESMRYIWCLSIRSSCPTHV